MTAITPYRISVTDAVLADLKARLRNTRWPEAELVNDLSQGAPLKWIQEICQHWGEGYDWRRREAIAIDSHVSHFELPSALNRVR